MKRERIIFLIANKSYRAALLSAGATLHNTRLLNHLSMGIAELSPAQIARLKEEPGISLVVKDRTVHASLNKAAITVGCSLAKASGLTGKGVSIAIVDTGIAKHPDLKSRVIAFHDLVNRRQSAYDDNGHGTHVAGIAAGSGLLSRAKYAGIAPRASLVGVKVLNRRGSGLLSTVLSGLEWCLANKDKYNIRIVNISLGAPAVVPCAADPLCLATEKLTQAGMLVVAAAGNSGPGVATIESPASCPASLAVGAADDRAAALSDITIADFSSRGPTGDGLSKPSLCAPGVKIISTRARRLYPQRRRKDFRYNYTAMSGTSMAAPIVSGVAALLLEVNPSLSVDELKHKLRDAAINLQAPAAAQGAGLVHIG